MNYVKSNCIKILQNEVGCKKCLNRLSPTNRIIMYAMGHLQCLILILLDILYCDLLYRWMILKRMRKLTYQHLRNRIWTNIKMSLGDRLKWFTIRCVKVATFHETLIVKMFSILQAASLPVRKPKLISTIINTDVLVTSSDHNAFICLRHEVNNERVIHQCEANDTFTLDSQLNSHFWIGS